MPPELPDTLVLFSTPEGVTAWAPGVPGCRHVAATAAEALRRVAADLAAACAGAPAARRC